MKKIILSVAVSVIAIASQAQFKLGVKGGVNEEKQRINVTEGSVYGSDKFKSYHAGLIADVNLGGNFYLQPQLLFSRKGAIQLSSTGAAETKVKMNYLELPVNLVYKFDLPFVKVFAGAGGAVGYAISGKAKQGNVSTKLYKNDSWRREDFSLTFTVGLEFDNGFFISTNSQKGMRDIYKANGLSVKNRSVSVSVGYLIDWNKFKRKA